VIMAIPYAASLLVALGSTLKFGWHPVVASEPEAAPAEAYGASKADLAA